MIYIRTTIYRITKIIGGKNDIKKFKLVLCLAIFTSILCPPIEIKASDDTRAVVCPVESGYGVKSMEEYVIFDTVTAVQNATSTEQTFLVSDTRTVSTSYSGSLDFEIIEDLLGISAEIKYSDSTEESISLNVIVPKNTTNYAAIGSMYVEAEIQYFTINSDCSRTWSGTVYSTTYTYGDYVGIYDIQLRKNREYSISYLDSLNLQ